jgi:copper chaperone CopZ
MRKTFSVAGMHCDGCERSIGEALKQVDGVTAVSADHQSGTVVIDGDQDVAEDALRAAIEDAGYDVLPDGGRQLPMA